jgi:DNA (cytosine-5)-methyltransferase 1
MTQKLTYISLFSCAGVGCYGFKQQGFECIATNEIDKKRLDIQKYNKKCKYKTGYIEGDITLDETKQLIFDELDYWTEFESIDTVDVLIATPPCQGMSIANRQKREAITDLPRNSLIVEAVQLIEKIKPKFFVFENVPAFLTTSCLDVDNQQKLITEMIAQHLSQEYYFTFKKLNFLDHGSNSSRPRCVTIGVRKDILVQKQDQIAQAFPDNFLDGIYPKKQNSKTVREVIGHLKSLNRNEINLADIYHSARELTDEHFFWIEKTKAGESAFEQEDVSRRPNVKNLHSNKFTRNSWDKTGRCILTRSDTAGSQSTIHPTDHRVFSVRELMAFQTIPNDFKWSDIEPTKLEDVKKFLKKNEMLIRTCIGESVPTRIFEQIAQSIKEYLTNP